VSLDNIPSDSALVTVALDDDRVLACCQWGPSEGEPLFVLHGSPGGRFLRHPEDVYRRAGARVITYDRPGYGGSTRLPRRQVSHAAADVVSIADQLGLGQFAVCGISDGGPHALAVAARHPDRVRRCATVVSLGPYGVPGLDFLADMPSADREEWAWAQQGEQALVEHVVPGLMSWLSTLDTGRPPEGMSEWVRHMLVQAFREALAPGPGGFVDDYRCFLQPWGFDVAEVVTPTRIMVAREDEASVAHGRWLASHIPDAQLVIVPGGHLGPRDKEEELLIAWLATEAAGSPSGRPSPGRV
jgi:pimeloyl-ACP methyl ester carboxylesterase